MEYTGGCTPSGITGSIYDQYNERDPEFKITNSSVVEGLVCGIEEWIIQTVQECAFLRRNNNITVRTGNCGVTSTDVPLFSRDDLVFGSVLARGGFAYIVELEGFVVGCELNEDENQFNRYVVKHLHPKLIYNSQRLGAAARDLAMEAQFLSSLKHKHILPLRGLASSGVAGLVRTSRIDGFFLVFDRLDVTLSKRIQRWRDICRGRRSHNRQRRRSSRGSCGSYSSHGRHSSMHDSRPLKKTLSSRSISEIGGGGRGTATTATATATAAGAATSSALNGTPITTTIATTNNNSVVSSVVPPPPQSMVSVVSSNHNGMDMSNNSIETLQLFMERLQTAIDTASALIYLHENCIIHRDLKPANIGYDRHGVLKLFDFGLAIELPSSSSENPNRVYTIANKAGTSRYMAPEVIKEKPHNAKSDVFSFTVLLWEILSLEKPYDGLSSQEVLDSVSNRGNRPPVPATWPKSIQKLLKQGWAKKIDDRPSIGGMSAILVNTRDVTKTTTPSSSAATITSANLSSSSVSTSHNNRFFRRLSKNK